MKPAVRGFTLIELLVAAAIFAIMAALAYGGLESVIRQRAGTDTVMQELRRAQLAFGIMARDFSQLEPRPVRDPLGGTPLPALSGAPQNLPLVAFTRGGWMNPLAEVRSTEERVAYQLDGTDLVRLSWPELDRTPQTPVTRQVLLTDVQAFRVQYLAPDGHYAEQWPPLNSNPGAFLSQVPPAVRISVTLKDWGEIHQLIEVARMPALQSALP